MASSRRMIEKGPDRTVLRLPRRFSQAGGSKQMLVVIACLFGAVFVFAGFRTVLDGAGDPDAAGGLAMVVGVGLILAAVLAWLSQARVEITAGAICGVERLGLFDVRRCTDRSTVNRLVVSRPVVVNAARHDSAIAMLELWSPGGRVVRIARRYRKHLLRDVAERLADELGFVLAHEGDDDVEFRAADYEPPALSEEQQASRATVDHLNGGLVLTVPRVGLKKASGNLMLTAVMVLFTAGMAWGFAALAKDLSWVWYFPAALSCGSAIGFWAVLVMALRSTQFRIEQGALSIHRIGAFYGESVVKMDAGAVTDVLLIDRDGKYAGETVKQLQIKASWKSCRMFKGRHEVELQWIVTTLRAGLGLAPLDEKADETSE